MPARIEYNASVLRMEAFDVGSGDGNVRKESHGDEAVSQDVGSVGVAGKRHASCT